MTRNHSYQRLPSDDLLHDDRNRTRKPQTREFIHHRSFLLGIFIGLTFAIITFFILVLSITSNNYSSTTEFEYYRNVAASFAEEEILNTINLNEKVRILCMVFTYEQNFKEKAFLVKRTWGKRCNKLLFMSNMTDPNNLIDITVLNVTESRDTLWKKTKLSFQHAYEHHLNDYDWFLKADDDTYVIMENLRYYLYQYPIDLPLLFGYQFGRNFMSGGAGYILSREAVRIFNEKALKDKEKCSQNDDGAEDAEMASCLSAFNVTFGDTRDELLKERFFPLDLDFLLNEEFTDKDFWYYTDAQYEHNETGLECCSNTAIAFHYESPVHMLVLEYLLYNMKKYQIQINISDLPKKFSINDTEIMFPRKNIGLYHKNSSQTTANNEKI